MGKYICTQCDTAYTTKGILKSHKEAQHEGIRYKCDQCDYEATRKQHLTVHKEVQHERVQYQYGAYKPLSN